MKPIISICCSANRQQWWPVFLDSLKQNTIPYEVIFVGNVKPEFDLSKYPEFRWIEATVKPCQCYQIAFWEAKGDLLHWTADDATYNMLTDFAFKNHVPADVTPHDKTLDRAYALWLDMEKRHNNDGKSVVAFRPIEDGGDVQFEQHYFFGRCQWTPRMAPFALIPRKYLLDEGFGYDKKFVSGQAENDVIMQVFADGGRVEIAMDALIYVHHRRCHPRDPKTNKEANDFRNWYWKDREALENAWVHEGYGMSEKYKDNNVLRTMVHLAEKRLTPVDKYIKTDDVCFVTQGEKGKWS